MAIRVLQGSRVGSCAFDWTGSGEKLTLGRASRSRDAPSLRTASSRLQLRVTSWRAGSGIFDHMRSLERGETNQFTVCCSRSARATVAPWRSSLRC
jgi:hypothetical protein